MTWAPAAPRTRRLPLPEPGPDGKRVAYAPVLGAALSEYQDAVVRLKCARHHDCYT